MENALNGSGSCMPSTSIAYEVNGKTWYYCIYDIFYSAKDRCASIGKVLPSPEELLEDFEDIRQHSSVSLSWTNKQMTADKVISIGYYGEIESGGTHSENDIYCR